MLLEHFYVSDAFLELHVDVKIGCDVNFVTILDFDIFSNYRIFSIQHMSPVNLHCIFFKFKYLFHWDAFNLFLKSVCTLLYF